MKKNKIPKIIHYCWFGGNPKSELIKRCIKSWKKYCPDYEIKEWNETNFNLNLNSYIREAYDNKRYAFVSDVARLWIIYNYGGVYLDTDVELVKNIDDLLLNKAFFSSEDNNYINTGLGFGGVKNNELIKLLLADYEGIHFVAEDGRIDKTTCPVRNTKVIKRYLNKGTDFSKRFIHDDICFLPKDYFCPLDYETKKMNKTSNTHGIHWFNASWMTKKEKFRKKIKRLLKKLKIVK